MNWVAVADFIEHVDQQALMLGRRIGDRVEGGGVIAIITASEAKRRVDADAARTDGCSWLEIDEIAVLDALFAVLALRDEGLNCL